MFMQKARVGILGASGYTGSELVRLLLSHPRVDIDLLTADSKAGRTMEDVFPQFHPYDLPDLTAIPETFAEYELDVVFCALPHGTTQTVISRLLAETPTVKVIDLSADFRLSDPAAYARWYGHAHAAPDLQTEAVYGLTEVYRDAVQKARLIANPGCYTTASILPILPLLSHHAIDPDEIIIDAKSGVTGAGRAAKEGNLFAEVAEGMHAYGIGGHRHMAELDQEFSKAAGRPVTVSFTPHLAPMARGILATIYVRTTGEGGVDYLHALLGHQYQADHFIQVLPFGQLPHTRHVRGSNMAFIGVAADRQPGRAIIGCAIDNLVKGAAGQAIQNMNVMLGFDENLGLDQVAVFP